jgi:hypothetical protein
MFALCSNITIGKYGFKPHDVKITKSVYQYADRAVIKMPISARIKQDGILSESVETAKQFNEGDKVFIQLGYNGSLTTEFEGFVSRVNFTQPLEVECEGYSYQLRQQNYNRTFINTDLKQILQFLIAGTDITLDKAIPSFKLDKLILQHTSGTEALELIKRISQDTIRFFFIGKTLYAGLQWLQIQPDVQYRLGWNVIKDGQLKLRDAKNQNITVEVYWEEKDGTRKLLQANNGTVSNPTKKVVNTEGISGGKVVMRPKGITDQATLKTIADAKLSSLSYTGYEGKITTFLVPYCGIAYGAIITDKKYPERSGKYLVESVETTYGMSGARRSVGIGIKLT